jgi:hypothetical protein
MFTPSRRRLQTLEDQVTEVVGEFLVQPFGVVGRALSPANDPGMAGDEGAGADDHGCEQRRVCGPQGLVGTQPETILQMLQV